MYIYLIVPKSINDERRRTGNAVAEVVIRETDPPVQSKAEFVDDQRRGADDGVSEVVQRQAEPVMYPVTLDDAPVFVRQKRKADATAFGVFAQFAKLLPCGDSNRCRVTFGVSVQIFLHNRQLATASPSPGPPKKRQNDVFFFPMRCQRHVLFLMRGEGK